MDNRWRRAAARFLLRVGGRQELVDASAEWVASGASFSSLIGLASLSAAEVEQLTLEDIEGRIAQILRESSDTTSQEQLELIAVQSLLHTNQSDEEVIATAKVLTSLSRSHQSLQYLLMRFDSGLDYLDDGVDGAVEALRLHIDETQSEIEAHLQQ